MDSRHSDGELMERIRDHSDPEAFRLLAERWRPRLGAFFRPLLGDDALAQDAVQEVLLKLWTARADYREIGRFSAYALAHARHYWLNLRRHEERRATEPLGDEGPANDSTEGAVLARAARSQLDQLVARLPEAQRQVWRLAADGLSEAEVASRLAVPVGTIKSRLHAARRRVWSGLQEDDDAR